MLDRNLAVLAQCRPEAARRVERASPPRDLELMKTPRGLPVHRYRGKSLHSRFDPRKEAGLWAEGAETCPRVIFGFGDAYHLEAFLERGAPHAPVVVEPCAGLVRAALATRDLRSLLGRIDLVVGEAPAEAAQRLPEGDAPWFVHPPSGQTEPRYLEALRGLWHAHRRREERLRVLVVGPVYGGSYPIACFVREALEGLGHVVEFADFSPFHAGFEEVLRWDRGAGLLGSFEQVLSWTLEQRVALFDPDLVFFLAQAPVKAESLRRLREAGRRLAYWFVEDHRRMGYWKSLAPETDVFFTIQREGQEAIRAAGAPCVRYLPLAALCGTHEPRTPSPEEAVRFGSDVSFVGAGYPNRRRFLARLSAFDLKIWGNEWEGTGEILLERIQEGGRRVSAEETATIFNASKINLNLHSSTYHEEVDPYGDFVNPRTFELAGCRAFQLVDRRSLLPEVFGADEVVSFADFHDARSKIEHYLRHADEREAAAARARERVLREHTYALRMQEMLGVLFERGLRGRPADLTVGAWRERTTDASLRAFLDQFPPERVMSLDDMAGEVRAKQEDIAWEERVFLTLMAFRETVR